MYTSFILILVMVLIFYIYDQRYHRQSYHLRNFPINNPYLNRVNSDSLNCKLNMSDICKAVNNMDSNKFSEKNKTNTKETECETELKAQTKKLEAQTKKTNDLLLKYDDNGQPYNFYDNDRYVMDSTFTHLADDKLAMKMKDTGSRAQESQIYRALWTKNNLIPYMEHELSNAENSIWWDDDSNLEPVF